jgi:type IV pilus assembly protein PilW
MNKRVCQGLTLIELMIGLSLSLLVLGAAVSVFMGTKESFRLEEDLSAMQEDFRFITDRMRKDFSMVGFSGCSMPYRDNSPTIQSNVSGAGSNFDVVQGTDGGSGSDAITITYADLESGVPVLPGMETRASPLQVSKDSMLYKGLVENFTGTKKVPVILLVGNCYWGDLFMVTNASDGTLDSVAVGDISHDKTTEIEGVKNTSEKFSDIYGRTDYQTATVYTRTMVTYEIDTVDGVTGLYETRSGSSQTLLMDNVTDMQILYGIDSVTADDGNADTYITWDSSDPPRVSDITSLRITLSMVVSQQNGKDVTRDFPFNIKLRSMGLDL